MFPSHVSTLAVTDPELIDVFENVAFDEVLSHSSLDARTRLMVQLASMIASQALRVMIKPALTIGVTPVEIKEIVYQSVPYVGMAKVFDFLLATNEVLKENGVEFPLPGQSATTPEDRDEKGLAMQKQIIGDGVMEKLYASTPDDQKHIQRFLSAFSSTGIYPWPECPCILRCAMDTASLRAAFTVLASARFFPAMSKAVP